MSRTAEGLRRAMAEIRELEDEFWSDVTVTGSAGDFNQTLERAGRVADFFELGHLMCRDALHREESAGGHFREEHQTPEGEAKRDDEAFSYVAAWEWRGKDEEEKLHREHLDFQYVKPTMRSYK